MEKTYTYEITENGYYILINGVVVLVQDAPLHIPNPELSYEENAKAQIEELKEMDKQSNSEPVSLEDRVSALEDMMNMQLGF